MKGRFVANEVMLSSAKILVQHELGSLSRENELAVVEGVFIDDNRP